MGQATRELGGSESGGSSSSKKKIVTKLVLTVSNFHFNREAASVRQSMTCFPKDCKISLKFSSEKFAVKNAATESEYHFDKSGLTIGYYAFMGLLNAANTGESRIGAFWSSVARYYKSSFSTDLAIITAQNPEEIQDLEAKKAAAKSTKSGASKKQPAKKAGAGTKARVRQSDDEEDESGVGGVGDAEEDEVAVLDQRKRRKVENSLGQETGNWPEKDPLSEESLLASLEQDLEHLADDSRSEHLGNSTPASAAGTRSRR